MVDWRRQAYRVPAACRTATGGGPGRGGELGRLLLGRRRRGFAPRPPAAAAAGAAAPGAGGGGDDGGGGGLEVGMTAGGRGEVAVVVVQVRRSPELGGHRRGGIHAPPPPPWERRGELGSQIGRGGGSGCQSQRQWQCGRGIRGSELRGDRRKRSDADATRRSRLGKK